MTNLWQDARYGLRMLIKHRWFASVAVATLALGIGVNTAIFSVIDGVLIRSLPFPDSKQLVWITNQEKGGPSAVASQAFTFRDLRRHSHLFSDMAAYNAFFQYFTYNLTGKGDPERLSGVDVSETFFSVLGVKPVLGRLFLPEECERGGRRTVILSNSFWRARLGAPPEILGQPLIINGEAMVVVGILPATFDFGSIFAPGARADIFLPYFIDPQTDAIGNEAAIVGRLKPGVTLAEAQPELTMLAAEIKRLKGPNVRVLDAHGQTLEDHVTGSLRRPLIVLAWAVGFVLLIACSNLSNLLLARAASRRKEIALRVAIGANRFRLIRQMITESLILSVSGGILGLPLAFACTQALASLRRTTIPMLSQVRIDSRVLLFTLAVSVLVGVLFGLVPALEASRASFGVSIKEGTSGAGGPIHRSWRRALLIVSEVSLSLIMLGGAGLMIKSFIRLLETDLGFHPERIAIVRADPGPQISRVRDVTRFLDRVIASARAIPGVEAASVTDALPLDRDRNWGVRKDATQKTLIAFVRFIGVDYFSVMKIPVLKGRIFESHDTADGPKVTVVNESLARTLFPEQDPVGREMTSNGGTRMIIGVVRDVKHSAPDKEAGLEFYIPYAQGGDGLSGIVGADLIVRTSLEPPALATALRRTIWSFAPNQPMHEFRTMDQLIDTAASPRRFIVLLISILAGLALLLAAVGIYGVTAYSVGQRTRELGIRMALGASAWTLQRQVVTEALILAIVGVGIGVLGLSALSRYVASLLFGTSTQDPVVLTTAILILIGAASLAAWIPARRAARIDPTVALRYE